MRSDDYDEFSKLLDATYDLIGSGANKTISGPAKALFFQALTAYPLPVVRTALSAHCQDRQRGKFTPKPADIIEQIEGAGPNDGRPGAEEAWAIAVTSRDESETVVWTEESAEAFAICLPVMNLGDEVGARMAFKEAYSRIVALARAARRPAVWSASLGWDQRKRETSLRRAASAGLLPAPAVVALLPSPEDQAPSDRNALEQLEKIKTLLVTMQTERAREAELHSQRERDATAAAKRRASELTANYKPEQAA